MKGPALDRSGSTRTSSSDRGPGCTTHVRSSGWSTRTPASRRASHVMSMCGKLGSASPMCRTVSPPGRRGATSSRAVTNCDDAEESISRESGTVVGGVTAKGRVPRPSSSTVAPRARSASMSAPMGRTLAPGSPSKVMGRRSPSKPARRASGGTKRITVPASPQSMDTPPCNGPGVIVHASAPTSTETPSARRASIIRAESRETSPPRIVTGASARAASTRKRLVSDLEPGTSTVASKGA